MGDRRECGYREFSAGEGALRAFLAARVWASAEGPRALFDRAVVWLVEHRVLLPGITVLARLVARYGLSANAPALRELSARRRAATLPATVRQLETDAVDDALDLFDLLMATRLLAKAERVAQSARLKTLPGLRRAAVKIASAVAVLLEIPHRGGEDAVSLTQAWEQIERVIPRPELAAALEQLGELVPDEDPDVISRDGRPTGLGEAFAHYGRIFKTLHLLQVIHDESYRRMISGQLTLQESRHALARRIRCGQHGHLREHYRLAAMPSDHIARHRRLPPPSRSSRPSRAMRLFGRALHPPRRWVVAAPRRRPAQIQVTLDEHDDRCVERGRAGAAGGGWYPQQSAARDRRAAGRAGVRGDRRRAV